MAEAQAKAEVGSAQPAATGVAGTTGALEALDELRAGGRVLSRYQRVVNLESSGGRLLAVHTAAVPATPFSLILASALAEPWPPPGTPASRRGDELWVGAARVDLADLRELATKPNPALGAVPEAAWARAILTPFVADSAFGLWWRDGPAPAGALAPALRDRVRRCVPALGAALAVAPLDVNLALAAAGLLVGAGPGGTPSGDDLLVGYLGAWLRLAPASDAPGLLLAPLARWTGSRTTRLAAEFYYHLARGRLSAPLEALVAALATAREDQLRAAAAALADYGATSGRDTIAGVHAFVGSPSSPRQVV